MLTKNLTYYFHQIHSAPGKRWWFYPNYANNISIASRENACFPKYRSLNYIVLFSNSYHWEIKACLFIPTSPGFSHPTTPVHIFLINSAHLLEPDLRASLGGSPGTQFLGIRVFKPSWLLWSARDSSGSSWGSALHSLRRLHPLPLVSQICLFLSQQIKPRGSKTCCAPESSGKLIK